MISVCMATYNGAKYIRQQLDSILQQLGAQDEIVVSDDGSSDNTLALIVGIDPRIKVIRNGGAQNFISNFENALRAAQGDYIFLSDQDDVWLPNKIAKYMQFLRGGGGTNDGILVLSDAYITDENLNIVQRYSDNRGKYKGTYIAQVYKQFFLGCTIAFTRKVMNYCLPFDVIAHDMWLGLLSLLKFKVIYVDEPLVYYRRHSHTTTTCTEKSALSNFVRLKYRLTVVRLTLKRYLANEFKGIFARRSCGKVVSLQPTKSNQLYTTII